MPGQRQIDDRQTTMPERNAGLRISPSARVIRAAAFKTGYQPSGIDTQTYLFLSDIIRQADGIPPAGWPSSWSPNITNYGMDPSVVNDARWSSTIIQDLQTIPSMSITMNLPSGFTGGCSPTTSDTDSELNCFAFYFGSSPAPLPNGVLATIKLRTKAPSVNLSARVGFSTSNPTS